MSERAFCSRRTTTPSDRQRAIARAARTRKPRIARRRTEGEASGGVLPPRAPTTAAGSTRDPRRSEAEAIKTVGK
jgi:hypothetical protein